MYYFSHIGINTHFGSVQTSSFFKQYPAWKDQERYRTDAPPNVGHRSSGRQVFEGYKFSFCIGPIQFLN